MRKAKKLIAGVLGISMMFSLCACGKGGNGGSTAVKDDMDKQVNLIWYIRNTEPAGFDEVQEEFNKQLLEKINATVDIRFIQAGDWKDKTNMMMAAQEEFDLIWTADWASDFANMVDMGALIPLDDLLETTPELKKLYSDGVWEATSFNGKIYGVPNNQVIYDQAGLWFKKDLVDKYSLPVEEIKSLNDLTPILQTVKDGEASDLIPIRSGYPYLFDAPETKIKNFAIRDGKVVDPDEDQSKQDAFKIMRDWYQKGFFPADVNTLTDEESLISAGKIFSRYNRQLPGANEKHKLAYNYDVVNVATNEPMISRSSVQSTMTSISATSKNPGRAIKLIELMETDKDLFNLLAYGLEGRDYTKDPANENRINRTADSYYVPEFLIGNQFLAYLQPSYTDTVWEETEAANESSPVDPNAGFAFDQTPVNSEITNLASVSQEFGSTLNNGLDDPDTVYPKYMEKRKLAGSEKVIAEIQTQYDAWAANNK